MCYIRLVVVVYIKCSLVRTKVSNVVCFFFQAEDGIRDLVRSRGLGDVYKRQQLFDEVSARLADSWESIRVVDGFFAVSRRTGQYLSLIHI